MQRNQLIAIKVSLGFEGCERTGKQISYRMFEL
jgi:hypothetical protein